MADVEIIPVPTRILTEKDDIIDQVEKYTKDKIGENDVISVAESVVAITQGRVVRPEDLTISPVAQLCCRFIPDYGSLASPHGMQSLMDVEGTWRVAFALLAGFFGKLIGQGGLFYKWGGEQTALNVVGSIRSGRFERNRSVIIQKIEKLLDGDGHSISELFVLFDRGDDRFSGFRVIFVLDE